MKLTTNFSLAEFQSKDGAEFPSGVIGKLTELAYALQIIRNELKVPISITSGYRSPEHNKKIGGAQESTHMQGIAADFKAQGMAPNAVAAILERLIKENKIPQGGLKAYASWVHYDIRGTKARW